MPLTNSKNCVERNDCIENLGSLDQVFLGHIRAEITTLEKAVGADDRQRNVMSHASGRFCGKEVATGGLEEFQNRLVLERRRVRHVKR
jgi:hypothetical protein